MKKNGVFLLMILICAALLVSCSKKQGVETEKGELVWSEAEGEIPLAFSVPGVPFLFRNPIFCP